MAVAQSKLKSNALALLIMFFFIIILSFLWISRTAGCYKYSTVVRSWEVRGAHGILVSWPLFGGWRGQGWGRGIPPIRAYRNIAM